MLNYEPLRNFKLRADYTYVQDAIAEVNRNEFTLSFSINP